MGACLPRRGDFAALSLLILHPSLASTSRLIPDSSSFRTSLSALCIGHVDHIDSNNSFTVVTLSVKIKYPLSLLEVYTITYFPKRFLIQRNHAALEYSGGCGKFHDSTAEAAKYMRGSAPVSRPRLRDSEARGSNEIQRAIEQLRVHLRLSPRDIVGLIWRSGINQRANILRAPRGRFFRSPPPPPPPPPLPPPPPFAAAAVAPHLASAYGMAYWSEGRASAAITVLLPGGFCGCTLASFETRSRTALVSASGGTRSRVCVDPDKRYDPADCPRRRQKPRAWVVILVRLPRAGNMGIWFGPSVCPSVAVARPRLLGLA
ncbi:hypothetical protein P5V15_006528 [Pogonomyrmex californicus]